MRKLASIQEISEIKPIPNADAIEAVRVNGWWVVSKKGEYSEGDRCVYFEVDSVLPIKPEYEFLRKSCYVNKDWVEGFRLKTIKLRKQVSQGLVVQVPDELKESPIGSDVTEHLEVTKWEPPIPANLAGQVKGNFPSFIRKTDQERLENCYEELKRTHHYEEFEATLKLDGSSCTIYIKDGVYGVCSRNLDLEMNDENKDNSFVKMALKWEDNIRGLGRNIAIQSELMGPGVQGNREKLKEHELFVFDVFDIDAHSYLGSAERLGIIKGIGLKHVPILDTCKPLLLDLDMIIKNSDVPSLSNKVAEGVVYKSIESPDVSFKVINHKFLLKEV